MNLTIRYFHARDSAGGIKPQSIEVTEGAGDRYSITCNSSSGHTTDSKKYNLLR